MNNGKCLIWLIIFIAILCLIFFGLYKIGSAVWEITSESSDSVWERITGILPIQKEKNRIDILALGIRGVNDPNGGLLTDSIMIISYKPSTEQIALISIPRDLYIEIPEYNGKEKLNFAYAWGAKKEQDGLAMSKRAVEQITGIEIDYALRVDFIAFSDIVDILGGIPIHLKNNFIENKQWDPPFVLEAGDHVLTGEQALYYVRSRFSTSDFDRNRRQQEVLLSIKNKALSLGVLANPKKILDILNSLKTHIRTDMPLWKISEFIDIVRRSQNEKIIHLGLDNSEHGLLKAEYTKDGIFILIPKAGENAWHEIQDACKNIFEENL